MVSVLRWAPQWAPSVVPLRVPTPDDDRQTPAQLVRSIEHFGLRHYWLALLPSRIGKYPTVDAAAQTFIHAHHYSTAPSQGALEQVLRCYGQTLKLLRSAMEKRHAALLDETLITIALVDLLDYSMKGSRGEGEHVPSLWGTTHSGGLTSILRARPADYMVSEITRAIRLFMYGSTCFNNIGLGIPSPVDDLVQSWRVEPVGLGVLPETIRILERLRLQLEVRAPRLVVNVRQLKKNPRIDPDLAIDTVQLARDLLDLEDPQAEMDLVRGFKTVLIDDPADQAVLSSFIEFPDAIQMTTAVLYWEFRLLVANLAIELAFLTTSFDEALPELLASQAQLIAHLLAAWHWSQSEGIYVSVHLAVAYVVVWAGLLRQSTFNGVPVSIIKSWLLPKIKHPLLEWTTDAPKMVVEHAANVMIGGPLPRRTDDPKS